MKKDKKKYKEVFFEMFLEIILTLIFFGIGELIISMLGVELDSLSIIVPVVAFGIACAFVQWFKKIIKDKRK